MAWQGARASLLLRGRALEEAERWLGEGVAHRDPEPVAAQMEFVDESRKVADVQRRRRLVAVASVTVLAIGLVVWGIVERTLAAAQGRVSLARQIAAQSEIVRTEEAKNLPLSVLLAAESQKMEPFVETGQLLRSGVELLAQRSTQRSFGPSETSALSRGGKFLSVNAKGAVRVISLEQNAPVGANPIRYRGRIQQLVVSDDGQYVATTVARDDRSNETFVDVWSTVTGEPFGDLVKQGKRCPGSSAATFSPDRRTVALIGDMEVVVRDLASHSNPPRALTHPDCVTAMAFSPDGFLLATVGLSGILRIWNLTTGIADSVRLTHRDRYEVMDLAFSPDGRYVASASPDRTARVWERGSGIQVARLQHGEAVRRVAFGPDGRTLATWSLDGTARFWDIDNEDEIARIVSEQSVTGIAFTLDGRSLITATRDGNVAFYALESKAALERSRFEHGSYHGPLRIQLDPAGNRAAILAGDGATQVWSISDGRQIYRSEAASAAFSSDSRQLVLASKSGTIHVLDAANGTAVGNPLSYEGSLNVLAASRDGQYVFGGGARGGRLWRMTSREPIEDTPPVVAASFIASAPPSLLTVDDKGIVRRRNPETGAWVDRPLQLPTDASVIGGRFSANGRLLATTSRGDPAVRVWNIDSTKEIRSLPLPPAQSSRGGSGGPAVIAFTEDGRHVAVALPQIRFREGNTVRVWAVDTGREVSRVSDRSSIFDVVFTPDAKYLITVGFGSASMWVWRDEDVIAEACNRLPRNLTPDEWQRFIGTGQPRKTCPNLPG